MSGSGAVPYPSSCLVFCALLHHCYFFACHLPCSQATYLSLLLLILKWLLLSALGIRRKFEEKLPLIKLLPSFTVQSS